jgi:ADP-ribose pyrophosphatase YjhB (NUDIX family)
MPRSMQDILESVAESTGLSHNDGQLREDARFCFACGDATVDRSTEMRFSCRVCGYEGARALTFRANARFEIKDGRLYHYSVGAALFCKFHEETEERIILARRATHPVGVFTIPSGHWDIDDVEPLDAARREIEEETGITRVASWNAISSKDELLTEECRRGSDHHFWQFFRATCAPEDAELHLPVDRNRKVIGEADLIGWLPVSQVKRGDFRLTKPAAHFLGKLLGVEITNALPR